LPHSIEEGPVAASKRLSKSDLREDKFIDTVARYAAKLREYQNFVLGGLVLLLILVLAVSWGIRYQQGNDAESRQAFSLALKGLEAAMASNADLDYQTSLGEFEAIIEQHGGREVGRWSLYYSGYCSEQLDDFPKAQAQFEAYLEADGADGEFGLSARRGIAACLEGMNRARPAAEMLEELAAEPGVSEQMSFSWRYKASQMYLNSQYYEDAHRILESLLPEAEGAVRANIERDLEALRVLRS
jgi:tetratricopeptide (TPR) repeat protein